MGKWKWKRYQVKVKAWRCLVKLKVKVNWINGKWKWKCSNGKKRVVMKVKMKVKIKVKMKVKMKVEMKVKITTKITMTSNCLGMLKYVEVCWKHILKHAQVHCCNVTGILRTLWCDFDMFAISQYQCGLANIRNPINLVRTVVICNLQTSGEKTLKDVEFRLDKFHVMTFWGVFIIRK